MRPDRVGDLLGPLRPLLERVAGDELAVWPRMCVRARKPSSLGSKRKSEWSNGPGMRKSRIGVRACLEPTNHIKASLKAGSYCHCFSSSVALQAQDVSRTAACERHIWDRMKSPFAQSVDIGGDAPRWSNASGTATLCASGPGKA
jgi:hypothetical protein